MRSPAAEKVSIFSSRLSRAFPRSRSMFTVASNSPSERPKAVEPEDRQRFALRGYSSN